MSRGLPALEWLFVVMLVLMLPPGEARENCRCARNRTRGRLMPFFCLGCRASDVHQGEPLSGGVSEGGARDRGGLSANFSGLRYGRGHRYWHCCWGLDPPAVRPLGFTWNVLVLSMPTAPMIPCSISTRNWVAGGTVRSSDLVCTVKSLYEIFN